MKTSLWIASLLLSAGAVIAAPAESPAGRWDAVATIRGVAIPFRLDLSGAGASFTGSLFNGDVPVTPSSATFANGTVTLRFDQFPLQIVARLENGKLLGKAQGRATDREGSDFSATRHQDAPDVTDAPSIAGVWDVPHESSKGEKAWRFVVRQHGSEVAAAILRVDGDTGALTGRWQDGKFVLSHFDGTRPAVMEVTPNADGSLTLENKTGRDGKMTAWRIEEATAKGLPAPDDFSKHTSVRDPDEAFAFRFPDIDGKVLSNDDPKFKGHVMLVTITGTWCPNCHDEAPYLEQLYKDYRARGLEVVALDFEDADNLTDLSRARAFLKKYAIEYTYLIAGATDELHDKVPQAVNLNTWPATFFIGKDGRVKAVHAGFSAPASGEFYTKLNQEYRATIERLLNEPASAEVARIRQ